MSIQQIPLDLTISVAASLIAALLLWAFRKNVREALASFRLPSYRTIAWVMAFVMLAVITVGMLTGLDVPTAITSVFSVLVVVLIMDATTRK